MADSTKRQQIYRCNVCGNIIEVMQKGAQALVCCGQPMELLDENTQDAATEKHVPVVEKISGGYRVTVGEVEHPMTEDHFIQWIELIAGDTVFAKYLHPGEKPVAEFLTDEENVYAREYCNLHGHWSNNK